MEKIAVKFDNISKRFSGVSALENVSFEIKAGQIVSIVGENGAGKSTLMNVLTGVHQSDGGSMFVNGERYCVKNPMEAGSKGIAMIHQELSVVTNMTVAENIYLGRYIKNKLGFVDIKRMNVETQKLLDLLNIADIKPTDKVAMLSISQRQMIEIAKAISMHSEIIIMDEPTSSLTMTETETLLKTMRDLAAAGVTILFISHRMDEVFKISDSIVVMRDGKFITAMDIGEASLTQVVSHMVGRDLGDIHYVDRHMTFEEKLLEVRNLRTKDKLFDVSFDLYKGEILGFAGLVGSGRTEVARAIFGLDKKESGSVKISGRTVNIRNAKDAIRQGLGIVTEDRKMLGLFMKMSVKHNITIGKLPLIGKWLLNRKEESKLAADYKEKLDIRAASTELLVKNLSGGNQQKVVIARWLLTNPDIMILDEPTRGVDVGSKAEIYKLIRDLANNDVGVILISSELPEILRMSDRVLVMSNGTVTGELTRKDIDQDAIMLMATKSVVRT